MRSLHIFSRVFNSVFKVVRLFFRGSQDMRHTKGPKSSKTQPSKLEDIHARVEVRRHPSARRLTLRVSRTRRSVIVTLPLHGTGSGAGA